MRWREGNGRLRNGVQQEINAGAVEGGAYGDADPGKGRLVRDFQSGKPDFAQSVTIVAEVIGYRVSFTE